MAQIKPHRLSDFLLGVSITAQRNGQRRTVRSFEPPEKYGDSIALPPYFGLRDQAAFFVTPMKEATTAISQAMPATTA